PTTCGSVIHTGEWDIAVENYQRGSILFGFTGTPCKNRWDAMWTMYKQIILSMVHYSGEWNKVTNQVILPTPQWAAWANTPFPPFLAMYQHNSLVLLCLTKAANYVQEGYDPPILTEQENSAAIQMRALRQESLSPKLATGYLDQPSKDKQLKWCMAGPEPDKQFDILTLKRIITSSTNSLL
ncbi:hypothetical protein MJO29_005509, partial [Puccinia striiformis f. sp. tritici]